MRKWWWLAGVVFAVGLAVVIYLTPPASSKLARASYVDPAECAGCHRAVAETYARTGMGRSFYRPAATNTIGGSKNVTYYHQPSESYFTMQERDGQFFQGRYQIGFDGKKTNVIEKKIELVLGSGNHARAFLSRTSRNTLVELPLAWYADKGGFWAMNPAYDRPDHPGFRRNVTDHCVFCHNGIPPTLADTEQRAEPVFPAQLSQGIDCQRCHGPGSDHVQKAKSGAKLEEIRKAVVNPARLSPERQLEVCMQCHLETTSFRLPNAIVRYERGPFSYRPGEPLADFVLHFDEAPGKGRDDKFEIAGAAYRLRLSECFLKGGDKPLLCTTCHNPHDIPRGEKAARHYTEVCRQCHTASFDQLVASGRHSNSDDCVGCHMPKRRTEDAVHVVMTDHYIQRRKPSRDLLQALAERRETEDNGYRGEVVPYYPRKLSEGPESELYLAVAQVSQKSNLSAGIQQLGAAIDKDHPDLVEYYLHLADAWTDSGQNDKALPLYEEAVRRKPDSLIALQKLGSSLRSSGQLARAVEILKRATEVAPKDAGSWHQLGLDYLQQGSKAEAIAAFEKAVAADPEMAEAYNSLGGVRLETGDLPRAELALREAVRIQPDYAEARSNLGNVLAAAGHFDEARFHFEAALRFKPDYQAAHYNYALALARARRFDEAQRQIEQFLRTDPSAAEAHDLLGSLFAAKGQVRAALDQYREAVKLRPEFGRAQLDLGALLSDTGDVAGALPHLRKAAESPQQGVREEAAQTLRQLGVR